MTSVHEETEIVTEEYASEEESARIAGEEIMRTDFGGRSCSAKRTTIVHGTLKGCQNDCAVVPREPRDQHFRLEPRNTPGAKPRRADDLPAKQRLGAVERGELGTGLFRAEIAEVDP